MMEIRSHNLSHWLNQGSKFWKQMVWCSRGSLHDLVNAMSKNYLSCDCINEVIKVCIRIKINLKCILEHKKRHPMLIFKLISICNHLLIACMKGLISLAASHSHSATDCLTLPPLHQPHPRIISMFIKFLHLGIMDMDLPKEQSQKKVVKKSLKSKSAATSLHKIKHKISKRSSVSNIRQRAHKKSTKKISNEKTYSQITFKDQKKHRSVLRKLPDGVELSYIFSRKEVLLKGSTMGRGILCCCCNKVVSPTEFERHAGKPSSKKPYQHIFLPNGTSLHQYASFLKLNGQKRVENNDILCIVCHKSGDLLFCDGCPRSFHKECISETIITPKKRFCKQCQLSIKCLVPKANAVKNGTVSGADHIEQNQQIAKQRILIDSSSYQIACVLCRSYEFNAHGFSDLTSIVCDQCEKEYHIGCLKKDMNIVLKELPTGRWFCNADCQRLYFMINLIICKPLNAKGYMELVKKKLKDSDADSITNVDAKWIVFRGKDACEEYKLLLTQAVDTLHDCFNPIIDTVTGKDFIPSMAYGKQMGSFNFSGVYSALLTINSKVITAGMFRVFGREFAELPIVATSRPNQGKGYFQVFLVCFERLLSHLHVKKIVIPAADNAKGMWMKKFGFKRVPQGTLDRYRQIQTSMVVFEGTTLLQRDIPQDIVSSVRK